MAYPPPWAHRLAERNLAAIWANYRDLGYTRLIYTNTASVTFTDPLASAMGDSPDVTAVLLTATDSTVSRRLAAREIGGALEAHYDRSVEAPTWLEREATPWVHRLPTDDMPVASIAQIVTFAGWLT
jgi:hypothetical protein